MRTVQDFFLAAMLRTAPNPRDRRISHAPHRAILQAVCQRNPEAAEKAMEAHMEMTRARIEAFARGGGDDRQSASEGMAREGTAAEA